MQYLHTNNAASNLRDAITPASGVVTVTSGHGTLFPLPGVDQGFFVTVEDRRTGRLEIMLCTVRTGDSLTVTRGQQGTIPQSFPAGVSVANRITAQILNEFVAATVNEVPVARLPMIPDSKIIGMSSSKLIGEVPAALLPVIPPANLTSVPAASLTGTIADARLPNPLPAANLPAIPASKLTSVPAASLTGTIDPARIGANSISNAKISDLDAAKLTGTINEARFPTAFSITGAATVGSLSVTGNVSIGGAITTVDSMVATGNVQGQLVHEVGGGYLRLGSYSVATYGSGSARLWYDHNNAEVNIQSNSGVATVVAGGFRGSGEELTGLLNNTGYDIDDVCLLLGPDSGHTVNTIYASTSLRRPNLRSNGSAVGITETTAPPGNWRALQSGSAEAGIRVFGLFARTS